MASASDNLTNGKATEEKASSPIRPTALTPIFENIPRILRDMDRWVVWRYVWVQEGDQPGRWAKVLFNARTGRKARSNDPRDCYSFEQVCGAYQAGRYDGVGIVHLHNDNVTGLDGDHCRDPQTGVISDVVNRFLVTLNSYTEVSPSGTGVRAFAFGKKPGRRCSKRGTPIEIYDGLTSDGKQGGRFLTVTGHRLKNAPETVNERQLQIDGIYHELFGIDEASLSETPANTPAENPAGTTAETPATPAEATISNAEQAFLDNGGSIAEDNPRGRIEFERLVHVSRTAKSPYRSDADFAVCCYAIENGLPAEYVFERIKEAGKIIERGRPYFEMTWKNAKEKIYAKLNGCTSRQPTWDISCPVPEQAAAGRTPAGQTATGHAVAADDDADHEKILLTDVGNGKRFVKDHGGRVRFNHVWGKWLYWDGTRWRIDDTGYVMLLAKKTIFGLYAWAAKKIETLPRDDTPDAKIAVAKIKAVLDHAVKSQHVNRLKAMIDLARSEPGIPILPAQLDANLWLFNCPNGTLDLQTRTFKAHDPRDYITKLCPTKYVADAKCPIFDSSVESIFDNRKPLIQCVQRFLGYSLSGDTREQELPIAIGNGANGKTLLLRTVLDVFGGDYAGVVPSELLTESKGEQHPTIKACLHGKRLMIAFETSEDARLNEARVKALTGEDGIMARRMKEDFWGFVATHKIILVTNHRPQIRGQDHGIWRRLVLWPFEVTFWDGDKGEIGPENLKADKALKEKLRTEHEGIFAWLVRGCMDWQQHGIILPAYVRAATKEYRSTQDKLGNFITERCIVGEQCRVKTSELWGTFETWCVKKRENPGTATAFGIAITGRGFHKDAGKRFYLGIELRVPDAEPEEEMESQR